MDCRGCRYYKNLADNHCIGCDGSRYTKPSNADRIRKMSDEELAENLCGGCCHAGIEWESRCSEVGCKACWLSWLKSPVEEGE